MNLLSVHTELFAKHASNVVYHFGEAANVSVAILAPQVVEDLPQVRLHVPAFPFPDRIRSGKRWAKRE